MNAVPGFRPLYRQVKDILTQRLISNAWRPGAILPSEFQLAGELGVSQGTVRKALDELTAENLLVRRQGRGTFVAEHDQEHALFHFFKLASDDGTPVLPESRLLEAALGPAKGREARALSLGKNDEVIRIQRVRELNGKAVIFERLALPSALFPDLLKRDPLPNTLYSTFARDYGVTVSRAEEKLRASALGARPARYLALSEGDPVLEVERVAQALDGSAVEWRLSLCATQKHHYAVTLA